jgi:hypothetical protein
MNVGMDNSQHVVAVLSPELLKADWPRFEWKNIVGDNPNNKKGASGHRMNINQYLVKRRVLRAAVLYFLTIVSAFSRTTSNELRY